MVKNKQVFTPALMIAVVLFGATRRCLSQTCVTDPSSDVRICLDWQDFPPPGEGEDFTLDYDTDPDNPSIELITGSLSWQVWAEDKNNTSLPANIGTISADGAEDYILRESRVRAPLVVRESLGV